MTRDEAADVLIEAYPGTPSELRSRRSKARRKLLIDGDHQTVRAMLITASPNNEPTPPELLEAVAVLTESPATT